MGEPLADFSAEGVSSRSCLCCNTSEKPGCEHSYAIWKDRQDDLVVEEIGMALTEVMQAYGNEDNDEGSDLDEDSSDDDDDPVLSMESDSTDDYIDSELVMSPASPSGDASESSVSKSVDDKSSIHCIPRLVSAMKGTRAKQGIMTKLSVSWAPDVYDPPVTSDSHTVRGHQRSSRKGHYKYKPSKSSSSSRGSSGSKKDKKHSRHISSSSSSKKDRKHSHRSASSSGSNRTDTSSSHYHKAHGGGGISSSRTVTCVPESAKVSPLVLAESAAALPEIVPVLKAMEPIKCATSCSKEKPFALLSRQFSPARYKGMFSFWSHNQLAS